MKRLNLFILTLVAGVSFAGLPSARTKILPAESTVRVGTGTATAFVGGTLYSSVAVVGNVLTGEDELATYTLPAGTLAAAGRGVDIQAAGLFGATANNKQIRCYFGATNVLNNFAAGSNGLAWWIRGTVTRITATTQIATGALYEQNVSNARNANDTSPAETLTADVVIRCTGEATATNDIILKSFRVIAF